MSVCSVDISGKTTFSDFFSKSKPKLQKKCFLLDHLTTVWGGPVPILSNSFLGTENCMLVLNGLNDCIHTHPVLRCEGARSFIQTLWRWLQHLGPVVL